MKDLSITYLLFSDRRRGLERPGRYNAWFQEIYMRTRKVNPERYQRSGTIPCCMICWKRFEVG